MIVDEHILRTLDRRLGRLHAKQRLGIERDHEAQVFGQGLNFFHIENLTSSHRFIRAVLTAAGLYKRGLANAERVTVRRNRVVSAKLPCAFEGYTILHLSDLHVDMCPAAMERVRALVRDLSYDLCVLTGDYRAQTFGPFDEALAGMARVRDAIRGEALAVLGNHDTICMAPGLEEMGFALLLNESVAVERGGERIHIAGIDDAHYFRVDNIEKAGADIPQDAFAILLSHTPEIFRQAAHAGFDLLLAGHTHGGQICLPGGVAITLDSVLPRAFGAGAWKYHEMQGYTSVGAGSSVVPVRFNCPPEITLHSLHGPD
jgi:predicted MPP superfamily phosphohydrolase